jgi:hypothetical protein
VAVTFDSLYGQDSALRDRCTAAGLEYYAEIKSTHLVYLRDPREAFVPHAKGVVPHRPQILTQWAYAVKDLVEDEQTL